MQWLLFVFDLFAAHQLGRIISSRATEVITSMSSPSAGWFWPSSSSAHVMFGGRASLICGACRSEQLRSCAVPQDHASAVVERCAANTEAVGSICQSSSVSLRYQH